MPVPPQSESTAQGQDLVLTRSHPMRTEIQFRPFVVCRPHLAPEATRRLEDDHAVTGRPQLLCSGETAQSSSDHGNVAPHAPTVNETRTDVQFL
ncbi:hypothetical protein GS4_17_00680 [Gordonia soli NBRC 108243]|uniref:Uncharacterized protein n=1 Tax=Gordonia soli NBRC 108243 TaxID=1223545 RepID=M0QMN6_9ACTN|nr:hypothetical protein GS4_17_00680 [Gordonia soli NBRC 108243]